MQRSTTGWLTVIAGAALAAGAYYWFVHTSAPPASLPPPPPAAAEIAAAPPLAASEPGVRHPIEMPAVAEAPADIDGALDSLFGRKTVLSLLQTDRFAQRVVATVDNLARPHAAPRLWPVNPSPGRFSVADGADGRTVMAADNPQRYQAFVAAVDKVDTAQAVALYRRFYPSFQTAYEELGYPGRHFNDRLVDVIDHLLQTPEPAKPPTLRLTEVKGPIASARPWVRYEFEDPALEALSSGQKMLLRMAPDARQRLKGKLAELRRAVASPSR